VTISIRGPGPKLTQVPSRLPHTDSRHINPARPDLYLVFSGAICPKPPYTTRWSTVSLLELLEEDKLFAIETKHSTEYGIEQGFIGPDEPVTIFHLQTDIYGGGALLPVIIS